MQTSPQQAAEKVIKEELLKDFPYIHHAQLFRGEGHRLILWLSVPWPIPFDLWERLGEVAEIATRVAPIHGIVVNELGMIAVKDIKN